uniref:Uncharacterized protein n=1 Tax=Daphnia magna TaxID=35525 RepID=A0A0N8ERQ8_9CRUS
MGLGCWLFAIRVESSHDVTSSLTNNKPLAKGERKKCLIIPFNQKTRGKRMAIVILRIVGQLFQRQ